MIPNILIMNPSIDEEYNQLYQQHSKLLDIYHKKIKIIGRKTKLTWDGFEDKKEELCNLSKITSEKMNLLNKQELDFFLYKTYKDNNASFPNEKTKDAFYMSENLGMLEQKLMSEGFDFDLINLEKTRFLGTEKGVQFFEEKVQAKKLKRC